MRLLQQHEMVNLGEVVGFDFYHLDHYAGNAKRGEFWVGKYRRENPEPDLSIWPKVLHPNDKDWGLNQHALEVRGCPSKKTDIKPGLLSFALLDLPDFGFVAFCKRSGDFVGRHSERVPSLGPSSPSGLGDGSRKSST